MTDLAVSRPAVTRALNTVANWHGSTEACDLIDTIVAAHFLSCGLSDKAREHIGYLEGKAVRAGLAHGWSWALVPHGAGLISAWEELKVVREEAIEMAMRQAGCAPYSWEANSDLFFQLGDTAPSIEQAVGELLSARDTQIEKEAA